MKRSFVTLIAICMSVIACSAQVFRPGVKVDFAPCVADIGATCNFKFMADFKLNDHFRIGPGLGIGAIGFASDDTSYAEKQMLAAYQLFGGAKWIASPRKKVSFILSAEAGVVVGETLEDYEYGDEVWDGNFIDGLGPTANIAPGIDIALKRGSLQILAELRWQQTAWSKYQNNRDHTSETFLGLTIGYQWGRRR